MPLKPKPTRPETHPLPRWLDDATLRRKQNFFRLVAKTEAIHSKAEPNSQSNFPRNGDLGESRRGLGTGRLTEIGTLQAAGQSHSLGGMSRAMLLAASQLDASGKAGRRIRGICGDTLCKLRNVPSPSRSHAALRVFENSNSLRWCVIGRIIQLGRYMPVPLLDSKIAISCLNGVIP